MGKFLECTTAYIALKRKVLSEKQFQKIMYFLDGCGAVPDLPMFRFYHFGPSSTSLSYELDNLALHGAISITRGSSYSEIVEIRPGYEARKLANDKMFVPYKDAIDRLLSVLPEDGRTLELWASIHFIDYVCKKYKDVIGKETIIARIKEIIGGRFMASEIVRAYEQLEKRHLLVPEPAVQSMKAND